MRSKVLLEGNFLEKRQSHIHGLGIFATRKIQKNKEFYLVPMYDLRSSPAPRCARIAVNLFVCDEKVLNWANHSCNANSEINIQEGRVVLRSTREISQGEEITVDYYLTEEKNKLIKCSCGAPECRNYFFIT